MINFLLLLELINSVIQKGIIFLDFLLVMFSNFILYFCSIYFFCLSLSSFAAFIHVLSSFLFYLPRSLLSLYLFAFSGLFIFLSIVSTSFYPHPLALHCYASSFLFSLSISISFTSLFIFCRKSQLHYPFHYCFSDSLYVVAVFLSHFHLFLSLSFYAHRLFSTSSLLSLLVHPILLFTPPISFSLSFLYFVLLSLSRYIQFYSLYLPSFSLYHPCR